MEINDLRVQKFNKLANLHDISNPQLLSTLRVVAQIECTKNMSIFKVQNNNRVNQMYLTRLHPHACISQIPYLKTAPKILYLHGDPQSLIIQQRINFRLCDYLVAQEESNQQPYLEQRQARRVVAEVGQSLHNYLQNNIAYANITPKNIVTGCDNKWELSVVGLLFEIDKHNPEYCIKQITNSQNIMSFALGCLLFKLVFGFSPISASNPSAFNGYRAEGYVKNLQHQASQKLLKVYHYMERLPEISQQCIRLIQMSLDGRMPIRQFFNHPYFVNEFNHQYQSNPKTKQIMMINSVKPNHYSLVMSAIDYKKNHQLQKLNQRPLPSVDEPLFSQVINSLQKSPIFSHIGISQQFDKKTSKVSMGNAEDENYGPIQIQYFGNNQFDPQHDHPCRELIKLIQQQKQQNPNKFKDPSYQAKIKLYGYPYAMVYELLKVQKQQPIQIQRKIQKTRDLFMQLSALSYPGSASIPQLHNKQPALKSFEQMKQNYRENINQLYQYFLNQAMRKYNTKNDSISMIQKAKKKQKGLQYYRLCLKLLQASLIVRKGGNDLNLSRIQTSQRKQIQSDLAELLSKYFPKKPQIR